MTGGALEGREGRGGEGEGRGGGGERRGKSGGGEGVEDEREIGRGVGRQHDSKKENRHATTTRERLGIN